MYTLIKIIILIALICFLQYDVIPNISLGYECNDPRISHKFEGDTVSPRNLILTSLLGPLVIITLIEFLKEDSFSNIKKQTVWNFYKKCITDAIIIILITEIIKSLIREPRPHFLDSCKPDSNEMCHAGSLVFEYKCTKPQASFYVNDFAKSFPSGHAAVSMYIAAYLTFLTLWRLPIETRNLSKAIIITVCIVWSLICSLSRIVDKRHHWWDVLGGVVLAFIYFAFRFKFFYRGEFSQKQNIDLENSPIKNRKYSFD